jgi:pantoate--beta-alanine ligase
MGEVLKKGATEFTALEQEAGAVLAKRGWQVEYVAVRRQSDLAVPVQGDKELAVLAAARLGKTRLIDNFEVCL